MNDKLIKTLSSFGVEVSEIQYKYPASLAQFGLEETTPVKFVLKGEFYDGVDLDQLLAEMRMVRAIRKSNHVVVQDLYGQLQTALGITHE